MSCKVLILLSSVLLVSACTNRVKLMEEEINQNKMTIQELRNKVVDLQAENSGLQNQLQSAKQGRIPTGVIAVQTAGLYDRVQAGTSVSTAGEGYDHALQLYRAGDIANAESAFRQFLASGAQGEQAALANYWLGDGAYNRRDYEQAISYFAVCLQQAPQGEKSAAALSKLIQTLKLAGRAQDAKILEENGIAALQVGD